MFKTQLLRGTSAFDRLASSGFKQNWKKLAAKTPGFTRLQEADYLHTWYHSYKEVFEPIIIPGFNEKEELVAIMCLAWHKKNQSLTHAGSAEYHAWLALPGFENSFLKAIYFIVKKQFPITVWEWNWMPYGIEGETLKTAAKGIVSVIIEAQDSPVWVLSDEAKLEKLLKSRSLKSKFNRFKKRGHFRFELITEPERLRETFETVQHQCDLRMEAVNNCRPFAEDPFKIEFCTSLLAFPGTLHASALWLDEQLLAFHMGIADKNRLCFGLISHDPTESKNSPGTLLIIELAKSLAQNDYQILDMTPGTDSYKDRFANEYQTLYRPTIYFSRTAWHKAKVKGFLLRIGKKLLAFAKIDAPKMRKWKTNLSELPSKYRLLLAGGMFSFAGKLLFKKSIWQLYALELANDNSYIKREPTVHFQNYTDLLKYRDQKPFLTRRSLLKDALHKFSKGEMLYSAIQDGRLEWFAWKKEAEGKIQFKDYPQEIQLPNKTVILYDFYYHSSMMDQRNFFDNLDCLLKEISKSDAKYLHIWLNDTFLLPGDKLGGLRIISRRKFIHFKILHFFSYYYSGGSIQNETT